MRDISIIGVGQTKVGEHWKKSLKDLASEAVRSALKDASVERVDALYVGNMLSGELTSQEHLGALVADGAGLAGIEALKVEAACCSAAAALRVGFLAIGSGQVDCVVVAGVEKMTDRASHEATAALVMAADADYEAQNGLSFVAINALLMRRYIHEFGVKHEAFAPFAMNAHQNAVNNPYAMFQNTISLQDFRSAKMICDPVNLLDSAPICDGAAAVVLCASDRANQFCENPVRIRAISVATDTMALHDRANILKLNAVTCSVNRAFEQAKLKPRDINFFEIHDAFTIMSVLALEASGFAEPGQGTYLGMEGEITLGGRLPISTMGGLKARGHPVGATGLYQIVEAVGQLRGKAGRNQIANARLGMTQNVGGSGATVVTTILESRD